MGKIVSAVMCVLLVGCGASFESVAGKTIIKIDKTVEASYTAFISATKAALDAGLLTQQHFPLFERVAETRQVVEDLLQAAEIALRAEAKDELIHITACILGALQDLLAAFEALPISVDTSFVRKALQAGQDFVAGYGGVC